MKEDTQNKIASILGGLSDSEVPESLAKVNTPEDDIRQSILGFFNSRITAVNSQERLKLLVQAKIEGCIEADELDFEQLRDLFVILSKESTNASQDILKIAHPNPGQSPLANDFSKPHEESHKSSLSSEEQRKLDTLYRMLNRGKLKPKEGEHG